MRRLIPLVALLAGCWPYIPADWDQAPDDTGESDTDTDGTFPAGGVLLGEASATVLRGAYWSGGTDGDVLSSHLWWGVTMQDAYIEDVWGSVGSCTRDPSSPGWISSMDGLEGAGQSSMQGPTGTHMLSWDGASRIYLVDMSNPVMLSGEYSLEPTATRYGTLSLGGAVTVPAPVTVTWPDIGAASPPTMDRFEFEVLLSGVGAQDLAVVQILLVDDANTLVDRVVCVQQASNAISVPSSVLSGWDAALGAYLDVGVAHRSTGAVQDGRGDNRMVGVLWQRGFVLTQ